MSRFYRDFFMININGEILEHKNAKFSIENRGYKYGDGLFETLKVVNGKIFFWEDHYFRLMASMRILRMDIPMTFTMEFLEAEILRTLKATQLDTQTARVRLNVDRGEGGKYLPKTSTINYSIVVESHNQPFYTIEESQTYTIDLYKDFYLAPGLLSGLKSNNKALQVIGSVYAEENGYDNCLVLNTNKHVVEALNGNIFLIKDTIIKTPPLEDGCLKGVMRKQIIDLATTLPDYELQEVSISPFELQKADELFITNVIVGIQPVKQYRKKGYDHNVAKLLTNKLNTKIRLS